MDAVNRSDLLEIIEDIDDVGSDFVTRVLQFKSWAEYLVRLYCKWVTSVSLVLYSAREHNPQVLFGVQDRGFG